MVPYMWYDIMYVDFKTQIKQYCVVVTYIYLYGSLEAFTQNSL